MEEKKEVMRAQRKEKLKEIESFREDVARLKQEKLRPGLPSYWEPNSPGLSSFFGAPTLSGPKEVPEVRRWKQNTDGSVTGFIYNSKNFKDGTRVTTSPVPKNPAKGSVVKTKGGSKYLLS